MKKLLLIMILFLSASYVTSAQTWVFAEQFASTGAVSPVDIKVDANGDVYVVGNYINELTIGGTEVLTYKDLAGKEDIFSPHFEIPIRCFRR